MKTAWFSELDLIHRIYLCNWYQNYSTCDIQEEIGLTIVVSSRYQLIQGLAVYSNREWMDR